MNLKLKRVLSIISLVFMGIFVVTFPIWLFNNKLFNGYITAITFSSFLIGLLPVIAIYFFRGFPSQQLKDEERKKIQQEYLKSLNNQDKSPSTSNSEEQSESTELNSDIDISKKN